jgi:hypothetical protein
MTDQLGADFSNRNIEAVLRVRDIEGKTGALRFWHCIPNDRQADDLAPQLHRLAPLHPKKRLPLRNRLCSAQDFIW